MHDPISAARKATRKPHTINDLCLIMIAILRSDVSQCPGMALRIDDVGIHCLLASLGITFAHCALNNGTWTFCAIFSLPTPNNHYNIRDGYLDSNK